MPLFFLDHQDALGNMGVSGAPQVFGASAIVTWGKIFRWIFVGVQTAEVGNELKVSSDQTPGCFGCIRDFTTQVYRDYTRKIRTTSAEVTLNGGLVRESPQNPP